MRVDSELRTIVWTQFGAAIDMLENAIEGCPEDVWRAGKPFHQYWYLVSHTLFWLDLYLYGSVEGYVPPPPFGLEELDPAGALPERPFTKAEMKALLGPCREKCRAAIDALTDESAGRLYRLRWGDVTYLELLLYNMRHVQHHAAQLNLILRQQIDSAPGWVGRSKHRLHRD
jgi:hypothetical protein